MLRVLPLHGEVPPNGAFKTSLRAHAPWRLSRLVLATCSRQLFVSAIRLAGRHVLADEREAEAFTLDGPGVSAAELAALDRALEALAPLVADGRGRRLVREQTVDLPAAEPGALARAARHRSLDLRDVAVPVGVAVQVLVRNPTSAPIRLLGALLELDRDVVA